MPQEATFEEYSMVFVELIAKVVWNKYFFDDSIFRVLRAIDRGAVWDEIIEEKLKPFSPKKLITTINQCSIY